MAIVRNKILVDTQGRDILMQIFIARILFHDMKDEAPFFEYISQVCDSTSADGPRDKPQIHLILANFECKKSLIKNCWIFLKKSIDTSKLFFIYVQNIWEDIIHGKYVQILI